MYIENIELRDFICFEHAKVNFIYPGKGSDSLAPPLSNVNLILGDNGSGKSAVLCGLALAVLGRSLQSGGYRPYMLVRRVGPGFDQNDPPQGKNAVLAAKIQLHYQDGLLESTNNSNWDTKSTGSVTCQTIVQRQFTTEDIVSTAHVNPTRWEPLKNDFSPAFFMVGYGGARRTAKAETYDPSVLDRSQSPRYQRVASIFNESATLTPIQVWWTCMRDQGRAEAAILLLNRLIPDDAYVDVSRTRGEVLFSINRIPLPFQSLSNGYRILIALITDLLYHLAQVAPSAMDLTALHGVVLIDELDLFLHPSWQRVIIDRLATTFPNLQFFITTHSPILAGTLQYKNIVIAEHRAESEDVVLIRSKDRVFGLSADQVLGTRYFGLETSRAPVAEERLRALAVRSGQGDKEATDQYMHLLTDGFGPEDMT